MIKYTLNATAAIRPMTLSALKALNPLDDEREHTERREHQHDVYDVCHCGPCLSCLRNGPTPHAVSMKPPNFGATGRAYRVLTPIPAFSATY
jgi:hypothetical protein